MPTKNASAKECSECGETEADFVEQDDRLFCEDCFNEHYFTCASCDSIENRDDLAFEDGHGEICQSCFDEHYFSCEECGDIFHEDSRYSLNDSSYCEHCYDNRVYSCYNCGDDVENGNGHYCDSCGNDFCNDCQCDCAAEANFSSRGIDMTEQHTSIKGDTVTVNRLVGVEVEAEADGDTSYLNNYVPDCVGISDDGSLNNGVECQTPPATLKKLETVVSDTVSGMRRAGYTIENTCGLHIHMDARDLDIETLRDFLHLHLYLEEFIFSTLPQDRRSSSYCRPLSRYLKHKEIDNMVSMDDFERLWYEKTLGNDYTKSQMIEYAQIHGTAEQKQIVGNMRHWDDYSTWSSQQVKVLDSVWKKNYKRITSGFKSEKYNSSRYCGVNMHSFLYRGTIEMRHHPGTLNSGKILSWIELNLLILKKAQEHDKKLMEKLRARTDKNKRFYAFARSVKMPAGLKEYFISRQKKFSISSANDNE